MAIIDAQGTVFTFDSVAVNTVESYRFSDGVAPAVERRALNGQYVEATQGMPVYGGITLTVKNPFDAGVQRMRTAYTNREKVTCTYTRADGVGFSFLAFVRSIPITGPLTGTESTTVILHLAGNLTPL